MSLKVELETWAAALKAYDDENFEKALELFNRIADSSKILTNMGLIYATIGEHELAVDQFNAATTLDQYLAVAYFQCGVSNFLLSKFDNALRDFEDAFLYLRGNQAINYEQLGLKFRLYSAEILFNRGLCKIYLGREEDGLQDMRMASTEKATEEHTVIDDAIRDRGSGYTVFSIPVGVLYRPSEHKLRNTKTKDYMGKARLIAATDEAEAYTEFTGIRRMQRGMGPSGAPLTDRPTSEPSNAQASPAVPEKSALTRSATVPAPVNPVDDINVPRPDVVRGASLARARTVLNTSSASASSGGGGVGADLTRSITGARMAPIRALSVRKGSLGALTSTREDGSGLGRMSPPPTTSMGPPPPEKGATSPQAQGAPRITEIYEDYIGRYDEAQAPPVPAAAPAIGNNRVAAWARQNATPGNAPSRTPSTRAPPSAFGGSVAGSMRRRGTFSRRGTVNRGQGPQSRVMTPTSYSYEEEEEGYVSGDYEDGMVELAKIRVKIHYKDDVRGMTMTPDMPFEEFVDRVTAKFGKALGGLGMKFKDEDDGMITLADESDFELAVETARQVSRGRAEGKLEIWAADV